MKAEKFFKESQEQSIVKATIVSKYFWAWAKVIVSQIKKNPNISGDRIAYLDLFASPGRYEDGAASTPLLVLEKAISDPDLQTRLITIFNDKDEKNKKILEEEIAKLPGIKSLKYYPKVYDKEVGEEIVKLFEQMKFIPTLFFVDPWGYKGLSLQLINSVLRNWGCDCIFFFNYNRINMGIANSLVIEHMNALFGKNRADQLRLLLGQMSSPRDRELTIIENLSSALKEMGGKYVLPFRFMNDRGNRTSHRLIFVSKHIRGYEIMKGIMAGESSRTEQRVPNFEYNPADRRFPFLFELSRPLDELTNVLLQKFKGRTMTMKAIYDSHHLDRPYIERNYKDALLQLENQGKIIAIPPANKRRSGTFGDKVKVIFPKGDD